MHCSLNILWHCPSLGLKWKLTFSSPVATAEFSRFADILSAALISNQFGVSSISRVCSLLSNPKAISPVLGTFISHLDLMNSHLTDNPVSTPASLQVLCFLTDPDWTIGLPCSFQPVGFSWLSLLSSQLSHCSWPQCMTHPI